MPVSFFPCITLLFLLGVPTLLLLKSRRAATCGAIASVCLLAWFLGSIYVQGCWLYAEASKGDPAAQYRYAQWIENHADEIRLVILWPSQPDVLGGYAWLEKSAAQNYPPAVWLVGVRLKHGLHVPQPVQWDGPAGNWFPQPARGQAMIDRATVELGYRPDLSLYSSDDAEPSYYEQHYRRGRPP